MQHAQQGWGQLRGAGITGELFAQPEPQPPQRAAAVTGQQQAEQPAEQGQQVQPEQAAQRPEHVDRSLPVAERGEGQPGTGEERQQDQRERAQAGALTPVPKRLDEPVTVRQPERAALDQRRQIAALGTGLAVGLVVVQRPGMLFAQAHGFGQPDSVERSEIGRGADGHAASRWRVEP